MQLHQEASFKAFTADSEVFLQRKAAQTYMLTGIVAHPALTKDSRQAEV